MIAIAAGVVAVLTALLYAMLGVLSAVETIRHRRRRSARLLGAAFFLVAGIFAPLHAATGVRLLGDDRGLAGPMLFAQVVALLPLAVFAGLRLEALTGERAERTVRTVPITVSAVPALAAFVGGAIAWGALISTERPELDPRTVALAPALLVVGVLVGVLVTSVQEGRRRERGGWSLSALSFALIFPGAGYAQGMAVITQPPEGPLLVLQLAALPGALVLLFVVRRLYNRARLATPKPLVGPAARSVRRSPWVSATR